MLGTQTRRAELLVLPTLKRAKPEMYPCIAEWYLNGPTVTQGSSAGLICGVCCLTLPGLPFHTEIQLFLHVHINKEYFFPDSCKKTQSHRTLFEALNHGLRFPFHSPSSGFTRHCSALVGLGSPKAFRGGTRQAVRVYVLTSSARKVSQAFREDAAGNISPVAGSLAPDFL